MKYNILKYITLGTLMGFLAACSGKEEPDMTDPLKNGTVTLKATPAGNWDDSISEIAALRFDNGTLREILYPVSVTPDGACTFHPTENAGKLHILANASAAGILSAMTPGESTEKDYLSLDAGTDEMTADGILMTGSALTGTTSGVIDVQMKRSVARLDISTQENGVKVLEANVTGIADRGYAIPSGQVAVPESAVRTGFSKDYSSSPLEKGRDILAYMAEQTTENAEIEVTAEYGGGLHRYRTSLPETIVRNNIYTVNVHGNGAGISVSVSGEVWEEGDSAGSEVQPKGLVNIEDSDLPPGIRVSESLDSVFVPHLPETFRLAVYAEPDAEVTATGSVRGVNISIAPAVKSSLSPAAAVTVSSELRYPGSGEEKIYLDIHKDGMHTGRIVLVFEANPIQISGILKIDSNGECDFGKYVDGELGLLTLPEGRILTVEFDEGEDKWMKAVSVESQSATSGSRHYRLLGGWKPNDPKADGRTQEGRIVFSDEDGSDREEYTVRRINRGLPVVRIGDTWWTKYNLRGNVKNFSDQVSIADDPFPDGGVAEGLISMDEEQLLGLMGDQYQGGNLQGLPLSHDGTAFYYEGMGSSGQNFGTLDPRAMAPDGYMIPGYDDFAFFSGSDNFNLGGTGTRPFNNRTGQRLSVTVTEREVSFLGHSYGTIAFYDFSLDGNHWVLYGLGHQWNTTPGNIARMNIILATFGDNSLGWAMEGYSAEEKPGQNWLKYVANNSTKTRTIRCIKTPVEYIYE